MFQQIEKGTNQERKWFNDPYNSKEVEKKEENQNRYKERILKDPLMSEIDRRRAMKEERSDHLSKK